jgi:hypothetical protein
MISRKLIKIFMKPACLLLFGACATKPYDYGNFKKYNPRSILVLPPMNKSTDLKGSYSCLSTITHPLAEQGYYVYPVQVIDEMMKENGLPTPGEMHQASLKKIEEIINPDAVLYLTVENYGTKFQLIDSTSVAAMKGRLVHTKTGTLLWEGSSAATVSGTGNSSSNSFVGAFLNAAVAQAVNKTVDRAHDVCRLVAADMIYRKDRGLLLGYYRSPQSQGNVKK